MVRSWSVGGNRLGRCVTHDETVVITEHGVTDGRVDTHARCRTDDNQTLDVLSMEHVVQGGVVEPAIPGLVQHQVFTQAPQLLSLPMFPEMGFDQIASVTGALAASTRGLLPVAP